MLTKTKIECESEMSFLNFKTRKGLKKCCLWLTTGLLTRKKGRAENNDTQQGSACSSRFLNDVLLISFSTVNMIDGPCLSRFKKCFRHSISFFVLFHKTASNNKKVVFESLFRGPFSKFISMDNVQKPIFSRLRLVHERNPERTV